MRELAGRTAIVTGAGSLDGIGIGYAAALAEQGVNVVLVDVDEEGLIKNADLLGGLSGVAVLAVADATDDRAAGRVVDEAMSRFGRVDILVNNAALHLSAYGQPCTRLALDKWRRLFEVNVTAPRIWAEAVRDVMAAGGGGVIINQSSMALLSAKNAYSVSKAAIGALTIALARELGDQNIRVMSIAPGAIDTGAALADDLTPERHDQLVAAQCLKRPGHVSDLVGTLLFLCSDAASFITGEMICVTGGARNGFAVAG